MSLLIKIGTWIKSHIVISIVVVLIVVGGAVIIPIIINNKEDKVKSNKTTIELSDSLSFEINSDVYFMTLIKKISNGGLLTENYKIDTSELGAQEIIIKYLNEKEEESEYKFNIDIVDTTKPIIEFNKELSTTVGNKIDLLKDVKVTDNSNEEIIATIEGDYDFNKVGTYKLKYVAVDGSNNKTEEEFVLKINEDPIKKYIGKYYNSANPAANAVYTIELQSGGKYNAWVCFGPNTINLSGTYTIKDNILTLSSLVKTRPWEVINESTFLIDGNRIIFKSGGIDKEAANSIGCNVGNFDCSEENIFYKK